MKYASKDTHGQSHGEFIALGPDNHVLTEKEWAILVADNVSVLGKKRTRQSRYKIDEVRVFCYPYPEFVEVLIAGGSR